MLVELPGSLKQIKWCKVKRNHAYECKNVAEHIRKVWHADPIIFNVDGTDESPKRDFNVAFKNKANAGSLDLMISERIHYLLN